MSPASGTRSISFWAKRDAIGSQNILGNETSEYWSFLQLSATLLYIESNTNSNFTGYSLASTDTTGWHHYVLIITNRVGAGGYQDGVSLGGAVSGPITDDTTVSIVGLGDPDGAGYQFNGQLSCLMIYDYALTSDQVQLLYEIGR